MQDLCLAIRSLRAAPIVTCVAILSLALGIGANTAVFSILDRVALSRSQSSSLTASCGSQA